MSDTRPNRNTKKRKKRRSTLRLSVILLFFVFSIAISFTVYTFTFDASSKPAVKKNSDGTSSPSETDILVTDKNGNPVTGQNAGDVTDEDGNKIKGSGASAENSINPVKKSDEKDKSYLDKCVFIGDSITTGLSGYKFVSNDNVLASIGLRIDNITTEKVSTTKYGDILTLDALLKIKPENVYILLGSNGVSWYDNDKMIECYSNFIDSVKTELPDSNIYIISITPVGAIREAKDTTENGKILNSDIDRFNLRLIDLANQKGIYYVDANSELKGDDGKLPADVTKDGMHFNKDTYEKFVEYILTHIV